MLTGYVWSITFYGSEAEPQEYWKKKIGSVCKKWLRVMRTDKVENKEIKGRLRGKPN